ncbi:MAG: hypothetical protein NTU62_10525 [Spirochaetes bacterium]|nr:hypothetical protein [Spirochaetota bacterium]
MLLSVCGAAGGGGASQPAGAVVVDLNAQALFGEAVPFYMKRNLGEFPRRIVDTAAGTVIGESEGFDADQ